MIDRDAHRHRHISGLLQSREYYTGALKHGDRKGRHSYMTPYARLTCRVVATLAVAMLPATLQQP